MRITVDGIALVIAAPGTVVEVLDDGDDPAAPGPVVRTIAECPVSVLGWVTRQMLGPVPTPAPSWRGTGPARQ